METKKLKLKWRHVIGGLFLISILVNGIAQSVVAQSKPYVYHEPTQKELFFYSKYVTKQFAEDAEFGTYEDAKYYYDEEKDVYRVQSAFLAENSSGIKTKHVYTISIKLDKTNGDMGTTKLLIDSEQVYP